MRTPGWRTLALAALLTLFAFSASVLVPSSCVAGKKKEPALPRLVDLGAGKCIPCKKMAPILEEMEKDYTGIVDIVFVDVWKNPKAAGPYRIRVIPTQIFYDRGGREVFRHEGFFSREEIEKVFAEKLGVKPVPRKDGKGMDKQTEGSKERA